MANIYELTKEIIKDNKFMSLATTDNDGKVWSTPLSYSIDENYNFYFTSELDSKHVMNIMDNPEVSFTIFDSTRRVSDVDGLQISGIVGQVDPNNLEKVVKNYYQTVFKDPKEREEWEAPYTYFLGEEKPVYRFFQIMPTEIYKRDTEYLDGDRRVKIDLEELKK